MALEKKNYDIKEFALKSIWLHKWSQMILNFNAKDLFATDALNFNSDN